MRACARGRGRGLVRVGESSEQHSPVPSALSIGLGAAPSETPSWATVNRSVFGQSLNFAVALGLSERINVAGGPTVGAVENGITRIGVSTERVEMPHPMTNDGPSQEPRRLFSSC